ncbi:MAG: ATP-binding cassette domain-containing protein [Caldilineaceae bacterium]|nr:ATP-binding cassette domain-containing protein [Caldilineaceae bacterium]
MATDNSPPATKPILNLQGIAKRFQVRQSWTQRTSVIAVDDVTFQVIRGRTVALVGESGCGKSTVGKILLGLLEPDAGEISFQGRTLSSVTRETPEQFRRAVQMVFQNPLASFNPMLSIGDTLVDAMRLRHDLSQAAKQEEAVRLLEVVGLESDFMRRYPPDMSGGQLQRVSVARALATAPSVIFLDEPTSALDMSVRGQIVNLLLELQSTLDLAYVLVSHDLDVVRALAHYVLVMYLGQVVEEGPVDDVLSRPLHPYTQGLLSATLLGRAAREQGRPVVRVRGEVLQLSPDYTGCKLTRRCPFELERCRQEPQALQTLSMAGTDQRVRCWRAQEIQQGQASTEKLESKSNVP